MLKKLQIYALLSILILYFFFLQKLYADSPATPDPSVENPASLIINEFSPRNTEHDWIELYVTKSGSIKGLKVYDDNNFLDIDENILVNKGDYILIYFKADEDLIGYNDEVLIIQNTKSGLTGTTEQIVLKNYNDDVIDFTCWRNSKPTSGEIDDFNNLSVDNWSSNDITSCFDSDTILSSDSVGRISFTDTDAIDDWQIFSSPTPGNLNEIEEEVELPEVEIPELISEENDDNFDENICEKLVENSEQNICTNNIVISEIFPNPSGTDSKREWIELFNNGLENCILEGWSIDDGPGGSSPYFFQKTDQIFSEGYFLVPSWITKINLNNSEDQVRLYKNNDELMDEISYKNAPEDESFSIIENEFFWTPKITPLTENIFYEEPEIEKDIENEIKEEEKISVKTTPNGDLSNLIKISEIFPNPKGTDKGNEWIELYNDSNEDIKLGNWVLDSGENSKTNYIFPNVSIGMHDHLLINGNDLTFSLKNSDGEVRLLDYNEKIIDQIEYDQAEEAKSYARMEVINNEDSEFIYEWTESISPGENNPIKNKITGEITQFDELNSKLYVKSNQDDQELKLNVLNDGASDLKNIFIKGTQISALASENENGEMLLEDYEVMQMPETDNTEETNSGIWLYLIPSLIIFCSLAIFLVKKYKIIKFK